MGYGLQLDGLSAFENLSDREERLARRPYSSYCFLLSPSADESALKFLERFAHDIDDLTGEAIAFLVLLDRIDLQGRFAPNPRWRDQEPHFDLGVDLGATYEIFEDRASRCPAHQGWTSRWRLSGQKSVEFARACGVPLDDLPCLVFVDAEQFRVGSSETEALVLPIDEVSERSFELLRSACARFYEASGSSPALEAMRAWDRSVSELDELTRHKDSLRQLRARVQRVSIADAVSAATSFGVRIDQAALPSVEVELLPSARAMDRALGSVLTRLYPWKAMKISDRVSVLGDLPAGAAECIEGLSVGSQMPEILGRLGSLQRSIWADTNEALRPAREFITDQINVELAVAAIQHDAVRTSRDQGLLRLADTSRPVFTPFVQAEVDEALRRARRTKIAVRFSGASDWLRALLDTFNQVGSRLP